ncbi:hypothetical protein FRB95_007233 [Tulasnella sp. JGI-2019a]|nr:hypothetical protein FRB95_007233 [Tulasnella sp. JGI-2019a]
MHSVYQRVNNITAFLTSCLFVLAGLIATTTFLLQPSAATVSVGSIISAEHKAVASRRLGWYQKNYAVQNLNFNVTADLSPLFHWNTKQLFVYITADYEHTQKGASVSDNFGSDQKLWAGDRGVLGRQVDNRVVIWDKIVRDRKSAKLDLTKMKPKYPLREFSGSFKYVFYPRNFCVFSPDEFSSFFGLTGPRYPPTTRYITT